MDPKEFLALIGEKMSGDPREVEVMEFLASVTSGRRDLERDLRKQRIDFSTVLEIANQVNSKGLDTGKIESYTITMMRGQFGVRDVRIMRCESLESEVVKVTAPAASAQDYLAFNSGGEFAKRLAANGKPLRRSEMEEDAEAFQEFGFLLRTGAGMLIPLVHSGSEREMELKGAIVLGQKFKDRTFTDDERELGQILGNMVAISLHNSELYRRSIVDGLTQVYSRGHFDVHLVQELSRARRFLQKERSGQQSDAAVNRFVSLVMADIDHFKSFNDRWGHQTGDKVLQAVARALHESVRSMDVVARYGGEEFALIFPETKKEDAARIAERLRSSVESANVEGTDGPLKVTISLGVATFPEDGSDMRALVAKADKALYEAKSSGRNRVVLSG